MAYSAMLRRVVLVRTDVSEEHSATFFMVTRIGQLGTKLAPTSNRSTVCRLLLRASVVPISPTLVTLMKEALSSSQTPFLKEPHSVTSHSSKTEAV
jgi:hypothetical protein